MFTNHDSRDLDLSSKALDPHDSIAAMAITSYDSQLAVNSTISVREKNVMDDTSLLYFLYHTFYAKDFTT